MITTPSHHGNEESTLFVATVASAPHMLSSLHVAFGIGAEVETYRDAAEGVLSEISEGVYWVSRLPSCLS